MLIGILGGSFDPPHNGHVRIANAVLKDLKFDQVWFVPCFKHPFEKQLTGTHHRLAMTKLLETHNMKVSDYEIKKSSVSYSIDTLEAFAKTSSFNTFFWIIGADQLETFPKWKHFTDILTQHGLIVVGRDKKENLENKTKELLQLKNLDRVLFLPSENIPNVSSSMIREKIKKGESVIGFIPPEVAAYISEHRLYR